MLNVGGRLVIYEHAFSGKMEGNPAFHSWLKHVHQKMYPMPPRPRRPMPQTVEGAGFRSLGEERPETSLSFSLDRVIDYLVSQSNVIAAVEGGDKSIEHVRDWLTENIHPLFQGAKERTFVFGGPIWYFMKS